MTQHARSVLSTVDATDRGAIAAFVSVWADEAAPGGPAAPLTLLPSAAERAQGTEFDRAWLCVDWLVRVHAATWLEAGGQAAVTSALRALPPIRDLDSLEAARPALEAVYDDDEGFDERLDVSDWDLARAHAWDAPWRAAWELGREAVLWAGRCPRDTPLELARHAARDAARHAGQIAVLEGVADRLRDEAIRLVDRMRLAAEVA